MGYFAPAKYFFVVFFKEKIKIAPLAGTIYKKWSNIIENSRFLHILIILHTFTILDIHKEHFLLSMIVFFSKLITKRRSVTLYMIPGGQTPKFWTKMTANIGIMQIISQWNHFIIQSNHKNTFGKSHDGS